MTTAESSVTVAVAPETVAVPVPVRPPLTVNALPAGADEASSGSLKVTASAVPSTVAPDITGGVLSPTSPLPSTRWFGSPLNASPASLR